jgi:8-oxo-dGTP pyrophosphatase MutT (NUDIX family)
MSPRTIRLRRPATLSIQEGVFVPDVSPAVLREAERRWSDLCAGNSAYLDGRLYHVLGVHRNGHGGCVLHVIDCAYRFFGVQASGIELGVRGLGVKGVVAREDRYLMGLRSARVAAYKNMWEFAPGGSMEPGKSPLQLIQQELLEETGLQSDREPTSLAVIFDPVLQCWELLFQLTADCGEPKARLTEYQQLAWHQSNALPTNLSPIARQIAAFLDLH